MIRQRISFILLFSRLVIDENMKSLDGIRNIKGVADLGSLVLFMNNRLAYLLEAAIGCHSENASGENNMNGILI